MARCRYALLGLALLVPAPLIGSLCAAVWWPDAWWAKVIWGASKAWMLVLPWWWLRRMDREPVSVSRPTAREGLWGGLLGLLMAGVILGVAWLALRQGMIDVPGFRTKLTELGITNPVVYWTMAAYLSIINALAEEYQWRWFVGRQLRHCLPGVGIVLVGALLFTAHHVVNVGSFFEWEFLPVFLASAGVCVAGALWLALWIRLQRVWVGVFSHMLADIAIFVVGWWWLTMPTS